MDCSLPGSSVDGIFQARILERVAISYSRILRGPGITPASLVSAAWTGEFFTTSASWEVQYNGTYIIKISFKTCRASLVAQTIKNPSAMQRITGLIPG